MSDMRSLVLLACFVGIGFLATALSLKICAFNIQSFGEAKAGNKKVMGILIKIISRCDLSLIQEVRDAKGEAVPALLKNLNRFDKSHVYSYLESKRLGRKTYKEQYVYIYRDVTDGSGLDTHLLTKNPTSSTTITGFLSKTLNPIFYILFNKSQKDMIQIQEQFQFSGSSQKESNQTEVFTREPFIIKIHSPTTTVKNIVLIGHHTCPKKAIKEIEELYGLVQTVIKKWKTENVMILGDLNAACSYVTAKGLKKLKLRNDPTFQWLITDEQDTMVRDNTHCAYDRIIVHGKELMSGIVLESAQPFNFRKEFHLIEQEALEVSDHYPIEVDLKPSHRYLVRHEL